MEIISTALPCPDCTKTFPDQVTLNIHNRRNHQARSFECFHCNYTTKFKFGLARHMKVHSNFNRSKQVHRRRRNLDAPSLNCPLCSVFHCFERNEMVEHYIQVHDVKVVEKSLEFRNFEEFLQWKRETEVTGSFRFVLKSKYKSLSTKTSWFRCFRDGYFKPKGEGKRRLKMKGSCKTNSVCPCSLRVVTSYDTEAVKVTYVSQHAGHDVDVGMLNLTKEEKFSIAEKLSQSVPFDVIPDSIRETLTGPESSRIHLITRKDLFNIKESFRLNVGRLQEDDRTSVDAWVRSVGDHSNVVRFYKPQSVLIPEHPELLEEDFVLILSYDSQIEMLSKFGPQCVCFEGTDGTNLYDFELTTLLVKDGKSLGFPCAFLLSNRSDTVMITHFLTVIKYLLPSPFAPEVLMSDTSEIYYNGWCATMPQPEHWLFCQRHVDEAWRKNLWKMGDANKRSMVYMLLRPAMNEPDENTFLELLEAAMAELAKDSALADFLRYFSCTYGNNVRAWAFCYRKSLGIDSNMLLESMAKVYKYIYLAGKEVYRLDKGIIALLRYVRDKLNGQSDAQTRGKLTPRIIAIRERHDNSLDMDPTIIPSENSWLISSESHAGMYEVTKTGNLCNNCEDRCDDCGTCLHEYRCTCVDSMKSNFCKHIHRIVAYINQMKPTGSSGGVDLTSESASELDQEDDLDNKRETISQPTREPSYDLERARMSVIQTFTALAQSAQNLEEIDLIKKTIAPIPLIMQAGRSGLVSKPIANPNNVNPCANIKNRCTQPKTKIVKRRITPTR
uniref:Uncharacterized protein n=1 Tax=Lygus hesperus TaxID=30085 RepID=A0A146M4Q8_LYGHE